MARPWFRAAVLLLGVVLAGLVPAAPSWAAPCAPYLSCTDPGGNGVRSEQTSSDTVLTVPPTPAPAGYGSRRSELPTTGPDVAGLWALGAAMVIAGVLLVTVRRRGARSTLAPFPPDEDHVWQAPTMELPVWTAAKIMSIKE